MPPAYCAAIALLAKYVAAGSDQGGTEEMKTVGVDPQEGWWVTIQAWCMGRGQRRNIFFLLQYCDEDL